MSDKYLEIEHKDGSIELKPVDLMTWARVFYRDTKWQIRETIGASDVSTVFLGLDHSFGSGAPILYETMVFGGPLDSEQNRYHTRAEAIQGHAAMLARVKAGV